jgi:TupA-like ATPgrasp
MTFNEKVLHRMLFDRRTMLTQMADKAAVRSYVESRLGAHVLPRLHYLTNRPETIPFDSLPQRFVVKPTHGSGWVHIVSDKSTLDRAALIEKCTGWLNQSFYKMTREWAYKNIPPLIMVEEFIDDGTGAAPNDYKLFVFGGIVEFIQVDVGRFTDHRRGLYTLAWEKLDVVFEYSDMCGEIPRPAHLPEMIAAAEVLGKNIDFIRADFYDTPAHLYFGELTTTPEGGLGRFRPGEFDRYLDGRWNTASVGVLRRMMR